MAELSFGKFEVGPGGDDVLVEGWVEVVVGVLSFVGPLLLGGGGTDLELVADHALGKLNRGEVIVDIVVSAEVGHGVVDLIAQVLLLVLVLGAAGGRADWIGLGLGVELHVGVELDGEGPVVAEVLLGVGEVLVRRDDITVEPWSEVVVDVLGWVVPFGLGSLGSELESVALHALGELEGSVVVEDVRVNTEVWHWVVDLVTEWLLLMLILGAAGRRANWIRFNIGIELNCKSPVVTEVLLSVGKVLVGGDNVAIELWSEVIIDILSWVVPLGLGSLGTQLKSVGLHALGEFERGMVIEDVGVDAKVWNWVVDLVSQWLLLMLVLSAASGRADWVGLDVGLNKVWRALPNGGDRGHGQNSHAG